MSRIANIRRPAKNRLELPAIKPLKIDAGPCLRINVRGLDDDRTMSFSYIDLFAGCGGLSLGLEAAGGDLLVAVERSPMAGETFFHNLLGPVKSEGQWREYVASELGIQLENGLVVKELDKLLSSQEAVEQLEKANPDAIVGGPPCQGFSLAGRRNPDDIRNSLPWQFLTLVEKTRPKVVVIENVVGMRHKFTGDSSDVFGQLQTALHETGPGYMVQPVEVNALHYGAPQHRPRLMIIGVRLDIANAKNLKSTGDLWRSNFLDKLTAPIPDLAPAPTVKSDEVRTVRDALTGLSGSAVAGGKRMDVYSSDWGVLKNGKSKIPANQNKRNHQPLSVTRFELYQWLSENGFDSKTLSTYTGGDPAVKLRILEQIVSRSSFPLRTRRGQLIASDKSELERLFEAVKTKKHSQRVLNLDEPARTVVTIGDDYVHPIEPRTFTVRELARFQGFPDSFEFRAKETTGGLNRRNEVPQYSQVGNAVSPLLARAVGELISRIVS